MSTRTQVRSALRTAAITAALAATITAAPQTPVFKSGVDLVQLDVSVLDKNRQPVLGLTQKDFTILEDGKPQKVEAFSAVDLPDVVRSTTKWMNDVSPDVTTNEIDNHRLFVLVLDDVTMPTDLWAIEATRKSAESFIDRMGPDDLTAVVFTMDNRGAQDLTSDRVKLKRAVNTLSRLGSMPPGGVPATAVPMGDLSRPPVGQPPPGLPPPTCWAYTSSMQVVQRAAEYLAAVPQRRKTLVYISGGMSVDIGARRVTGRLSPEPTSESERKRCGEAVVNAMTDAFRAAQRGNVNIYGMDPMGLRVGSMISPGGIAVEFLQTVSDNTGGHAIINTNDFEPGLTQIFRENSSYYLLGYQPANVKADGTFRRLEVKVNRPGVEVRTRKNYIAPAPPNAKAPPPPSPAVAAMADILPKADLPLRVVVAPFAIPGEPAATVTIALGLRRPALTERLTDEVDWLLRAFTPEGGDRGSADQTTSLILPVARRGSDVSRFDLLARMDLKPGRYALRISAHSATLDKRGSVYADVEIPDFEKEPLTLSGVLMSVLPGEPIAPAEALSGVVPVIPTTERAFTRFERASTFLRVYQGGKDAPASVSLAIRLVDSQDKAVVTQTDTLAPDRFASARAADVRFALPLTQLAPGDYLLTFEATMGKTVGRRDVRFSVK